MSILFDNTHIQWLDYRHDDLLANDDINVFKINCSVYSRIEENLTAILTKAEVEKKNRFFKKADAVRFALGKYFLRKILGEQVNSSPKSIHFLLTETNKPYLSEINFNISHSGDYVAIAISKKVMGIDVELIRNNFDYSSIAMVCFTADERALITNIKDFYTLWTRKEAVLKASGEGIVDNLHDIECIKPYVQWQKNHYQLKSYLIDDGHLLSLAYTESAQNFQFWNLDLY